MQTALPSSPAADGRHLLTHSRLACARKCPRRHWYAYELGLRPDRQSAPLRIGGAVHLGLDLLARGVDRENALDRAVAGYADFPAWCGSEDDRRAWLYERETVLRLLHAYSCYWEEQGLQVIATEQAFEIAVVNPATGAPATAHRLAGKIDKIIRLPDGRLAVMEHKTTSDSLDADSDYWSRLRIDGQISLYIHAARERGFDAVTVLYDVIRKPAIQPTAVPLLDADGLKQVVDANGERVRTKDGKKWRETADAAAGYRLLSRPMTPEEWGDKLSADICDRPDRYFARREIARLDSDLDGFRRELWWQHQDLLGRRREGHWPRNPEACLSPFPCEYRDVCWGGLDVEAQTPEGFVRLEFVHPELIEV